MANDTDSVGFYAAEVLTKTAAAATAQDRDHRQRRRADFRRAQSARAGVGRPSATQEGIRQGDRVGVLLPNSTAIPLSYYATQKIGAVTVILDARLKGKELQGVLKDADLKLLVVHNQLVSGS